MGGGLQAAVLLLCPVPSSAGAEASKQRARILSFMEHASLLYRCLTPTSTWYRYFHRAALPAFLSGTCTGTAPAHAASTPLDMDSCILVYLTLSVS